VNIFVLNVGSTSTKVALFERTTPVVNETITYSSEELAHYGELRDQLSLREADILRFAEKNTISFDEIDMIISRGGVFKPLIAGAYHINEKMCEDGLSGTYGIHPASLGPRIALDIAEKHGKPAIIIDPPTTDEFDPLARISGIPEIERKSGFHALNQKAAARRAAAEIGKSYENINLIVAHLGGGITIGAHRRGRVVDCAHGLSEGPFTPERAGSLPTTDLVDLALSGTVSQQDIRRKLVGQGGLSAYLGTSDAVAVERMIAGGNEEARFIYSAMAYQITKEIGAMTAVLKGDIEAIVLTGGLAHSQLLTGWISEWVSFIAPVVIFPGEDEMTAMAEGALRVLKGKEEIRIYE